MANVSNNQIAGVDGLTERIPGEIVSNKICLEQGAHLRVSGTGMVQDEKVDLESYHVDDNRGNNETSNAGPPVPKLVSLSSLS